MNSDFLSLMPGFTAGCVALYKILSPVVLVLMFAGLTIIVIRALEAKCLRALWPFFVRMAVISFLVGGGLVLWGNTTQSAVTDLISQLGLNQGNGNVYEAYRNALAQRFGSNNAAANATLQGSGTNQQTSFVTTEGDTSEGFSQPSTGVTLTHYAYSGDSTPDGNSSQGIGAFAPFNTPNSLVPLQSAALSPDMVAKYNVQQGQQFTITTPNGPMTLQYADNTDPGLTGRVDVYDPNNALGGGNNFSEPVTSFNDGALMSNATGSNPTALDWMSNPIGTLQKFVIDRLVWLLSLAALGIMWIMSGVQQILWMIEVAVSPIFLGCLLVPPLIRLGTVFLMSLFALCLWPLAWAVTDLVTRGLIDLALNPTSNPGMQIFSTGAMLLGYWILLAIWVIGSSIIAPWIVTKAFTGGTSAITAVMAGTLGAALLTAPRVATNVATSAAAVSAGGATAPLMLASATRMNGATQNFARRPISQPSEAT